MIFNSYEFIFIFLPIAALIYFSLLRLGRALPIAWLAIVSVFFYAYWSLRSLPILAASILLNYFIGRELSRGDVKTPRIVLWFGILINLAVLMYFKYINFFIDNLNYLSGFNDASGFDHLQIFLPIGISFFTFTQIAYLIDCAQKKAEKSSFVDYVFFVTFFPHLIAGPIIHHKQIIGQVQNREFSVDLKNKVAVGLFIFSLGMAKKVLLADPFGGYANTLFNHAESLNNLGLIGSWLGSLAYTFQLYFDFSGYSDMAVGLGLMFGIFLPLNFNSPFKASSIINFWQRWHISLTKYIAEYLYNPLSLWFMRRHIDKTGFSQAALTLFLPTLITFLIIGFWHGSEWTFVLFGVMHGVLIVINHSWRMLTKKWKPRKLLSEALIPVYWLITFLSVNLSFVMFRSDSVKNAVNIYRAMFNVENIGSWTLFLGRLPSYDDIKLPITAFICLAFFIILGSKNSAQLARFELLEKNGAFGLGWPKAILASALLFASLICLDRASPFLYVQF